MQEVLKQERTKTSFDVKKMQKFLYGDDLEPMLKALDHLAKTFPIDPNLFGEGRIQMMRQALKYVTTVLNNVDVNQISTLGAMFLHSQFQMPGTVHLGMFIICLKLLGQPQVVDKYLQKCFNCDVIGCYAQTQMGHGSDVQSIMTTATFDAKTDEIVLHTPCIEAMKFWPGDMGLYANYALVFARLLVDGQDQGVHAFLARIRDDQMNPMPGVEVGDIGPKIGYITKDNGYMRLTHVRIPRTQMMSKVVGLTRQGQLQVKGNPKIVYATMMIVRKVICSVWPKMYAQALTIATRYSMFRKQFRDDHHQQQAIIEYQLQQNKLAPLLAEYYAITVGGASISKLTDQNFKRVVEANDESLMAETHSTLCYGKSYFSDVAMRGIEICRLACGGHGFSHYSGLPAIVNEYYPNPTHQGENTVMYLQTARYIMKCFNRSVLQKKEPLQHSVRYLESYDYLLRRKCQVSSTQNWTIEQIRLLLAQTVCQQIRRIHQCELAHKNMPKTDLNGKHLGIQLVQAAITHSMYNTYYNFEQAIVKFMGDEVGKKLLFELCMLYGISSLQQKSVQLVMSGAIEPQHIHFLQHKKEQLMKNIRPQLIGLVDSCAIPDSCLKSAIATGGCPYQQMFELARKNSLNINDNSIPAALTIRKALNRPRL